jgi:hypothetical protein
LSLEKLTLPVGVICAPPFVSVAVAVHVVGLPTWPGEGEHVTVVEVEC